MTVYTDVRGHALTTTSEAAAGHVDRAMHGFLHWTTGAMQEVGAALEADPEFGMAHVVNGLFMFSARNTGLTQRAAGSLKAARAVEASMTPREKLYLRALEASLAGDISRAVLAYEEILTTHPRDLFAQRLAQAELFWIGEMRWSESISRRLVHHWDASVPSYGVHLSCRAFDLEETLRFDEAEALGRRAVDVDPTDAWGAHAVAHVLVMQGRHEEGIAWLDGLKSGWDDLNQIVFHLWWHRCLFHVERGEFDTVLDIYDNWVRNRELGIVKSMPDLYIDMQNGASMLLRLELRGVDVGHRWDELAELALGRLEDHSSPFTSAHFAIILAAAGRFEEAEALIASMRGFAASDTGTLGPRYAAAAVPASDAAVAHRKGEHDRVVELLMPARHMLWQMGGSHAQRDLFFLVLADALLKTGQMERLAIVLDDIERAGFADAASRIGYSAAAEKVH